MVLASLYSIRIIYLDIAVYLDSDSFGRGTVSYVKSPADTALKKGHEEYLKEFESYLQSNGFSKITIKNYISDLKKFLAWKGKDPFFATDVEDYRKFLISTNVALATEKRIISTVIKFAGSINLKTSPVVMVPVHGMNKSAAFVTKNRKYNFSKFSIVIGLVVFVGLLSYFLLRAVFIRNEATIVPQPLIESRVLGGQDTAVSSDSSSTDNNDLLAGFLADLFFVRDARNKKVLYFDDKYAKYGVTSLQVNAELDVYEDAYFYKKVNIEDDIVVAGDIFGRGGLTLTGDANFLNDLSLESDLDVEGDLYLAQGSELYSFGSKTLGDRVYAEDNYVTDGQTFTSSIDVLDIQLADVVAGVTGVWTRNSVLGRLYPTAINDNVGIGTIDPGAYRLNVNGNTNITGNLVVTGDVDSLTGTIVTLDGTTLTYTTGNITTLDLGTNTISDSNFTGNWGFN
ncbi:hypothetical protein CO058_00130, partial [candidate division WWE3 bacterium CG_4_9_14_0_2_um_filter_35_11]